MSAEKKQRAFHGLNSDFNKEKRSFLLIFFYHQKTKDHSMSFTRTATTDGFGRSVQITNGRFVATMMTGLLPVADMVSRIQLLAPFEQALEQTHKPKDRSLYSAGAMFR